MYNHYRKYAEDMDDTYLSFSTDPSTAMMGDHVKFDRLNLYDFRRSLPTRDREAKLDKNGCSWGYGKRKSSIAQVRLKPGKGTITVNGKNVIDYFHYPSQRYRMLLPLTLTRYTCLLDVDIWVHGGGYTG